jgi:Uncharacterized protein involved in cytokinesis, contains TGc (transglutaminase/protease-like) domain
MKLPTYLFIFTIALLIVSCSKTNENTKGDNNEQTQVPEKNKDLFSIPDNSVALTPTSPAESVCAIFKTLKKDVAAELGSKNSFKIEESQISEIKTFTDDLVKDGKTEMDKTKTILKWIKDNVKYHNNMYESYDVLMTLNEPYNVFKNKVAICQGYANLMEVMLHTQGIVAFVANGFLGTLGGHAWNYANVDGLWRIMDPTNDGSTIYNLEDLGGYKNNLIPHSLDIPVLFKDEKFTYNFTECHLNVNSVLSNDADVVIPYSVNGFVVSSFNPSVDIPSGVSKIFIGKNIQTLGENIVGIRVYEKSVEEVYVFNENRYLESVSNCVYKKAANMPLYIPSKLKSITLKNIEVIEKNAVCNHDCIEEITFQKNTKIIEAYAVEKCKSLKVAYIPTAAKVDEKAFVEVASDFKIVRKD